MNSRQSFSIAARRRRGHQVNEHFRELGEIKVHLRVNQPGLGGRS